MFSRVNVLKQNLVEMTAEINSIYRKVHSELEVGDKVAVDNRIAIVTKTHPNEMVVSVEYFDGSKETVYIGKVTEYERKN